MRLEEKSARRLQQAHKTLSIAESCTGGLLAHRITSVPGASNFFHLGLVTYHNHAKSTLLKVPLKILRAHGAVSEEVAMAMARAVRKPLKSDFGIGITGIAGPSGGTAGKPVGLTYIAVATEAETLCLKCIFTGTRARIKSQAATQALKLLLEFL